MRIASRNAVLVTSRLLGNYLGMEDAQVEQPSCGTPNAGVPLFEVVRHRQIASVEHSNRLQSANHDCAISFSYSDGLILQKCRLCGVLKPHKPCSGFVETYVTRKPHVQPWPEETNHFYTNFCCNGYFYVSDSRLITNQLHEARSSNGLRLKGTYILFMQHLDFPPTGGLPRSWDPSKSLPLYMQPCG